jgi:hypothetical protein
MAHEFSHHLQTVVLAKSTAYESIISKMRAMLADMRATTGRTIALVDATRDALAAADDLLAQSISRAPQRK